jgi:hypothetical protein
VGLQRLLLPTTFLLADRNVTPLSLTAHILDRLGISLKNYLSMKNYTKIEDELFDDFDRLYHYTTIELFYKIITSGQLWVSKFNYLNDPT